jgi:primosomal protein N' (replication factor Y)
MAFTAAESSDRIARVEPLTRTRALRGPFDYRLGPDQDVQVGALLRIPFAGRSTLGVVVELAAQSQLEPDRLAEPDAVLEGGLPGDLVELALWMAKEYCSTPARALALMLAPGAAQGIRRREVLVAELSAAGARAPAQQPGLTVAQRALVERLRQDGPTVAARVGTAALRRLERRGLVTLVPHADRRRPELTAVGAASSSAPLLTDDQESVLAEVLDALRSPRSPVPGRPEAAARYLLHGVTGSGKTEVYLRAVEATLEAGRDAIVLVPEIALTPQTLGRFQRRFGDVVAVLHSALGRGERHDEWLALRTGEARVCVGPRSAVFAPLRDVGLIVVDEEHDSSYKHEGDPRYDARTVALRRAEQRGAVLLCGSATPRPESVVSMRRLRLSRRIDRRALPAVEVLDMRGQHHPLHPRTRMALADVRRHERKAIVLLNRRGWSNFLCCHACGTVWMCPNCEVALVLHRAAGPGTDSFVACHHCGHRERVLERCRSCGSVALARHGAGTERLEQELREALGSDGFPIFRLDADTAAGKDRAGITLARFESADAGLLVGTQMVAKGHDFPDVTLGVVLDADQTLRFPDFRAEERTFSLVTQLAGRAGRGDAGGAVLVQTLAPEARSIACAARHDADAFLGQELEHRRALGYPPFGSLIRIVCAAPEVGGAVEIANELRARIAAPGATVLGPAPLFRLRGRERSQLVVKATERSGAIEAVGNAVDGVAVRASRSGVSVSVDVDPQ